MRRREVIRLHRETRPRRAPSSGIVKERAALAVLNTIYEEDFLGFPYGFRPKRSQHDALDALIVGITSKNVNWIASRIPEPTAPG
jgi:RNA-directed DNA polymerase